MFLDCVNGYLTLVVIALSPPPLLLSRNQKVIEIIVACVQCRHIAHDANTKFRSFELEPLRCNPSRRIVVEVGLRRVNPLLL